MDGRRLRAIVHDVHRAYFYLPPAGGLGWALPAALGAKLTTPDRTVVAALGDGAYLFANPGRATTLRPSTTCPS